MKLERIVKRFYDELENGKIMGRKCKRCGVIEFPPVLICNACSGMDMEWVEMSGKGWLTDIMLPSIVSAVQENDDLRPYCYGVVEVEGARKINMIVQGVSPKNKPEITAKLPVPVRMKIIDRESGKTVICELAEE